MGRKPHGNVCDKTGAVNGPGSRNGPVLYLEGLLYLIAIAIREARPRVPFLLPGACEGTSYDQNRPRLSDWCMPECRIRNMNRFTPNLHWNYDSKMEIHSLAELDGVLDHIASEIGNGMGFSVEFSMNENTCLLITLGADKSHVEYFQKDGRPPVIPACGDVSEAGSLTFLHRGEPSSVLLKSCVPVERARQAMRDYYQTGERPASLNWS